MNNNRFHTANELDSIRRARGNRACRTVFHRLALNRKDTALRLINDDTLQFASLYILWPDIMELGLMESLCERNKLAYRLCERMTREKKTGDSLEKVISLDSEETHSVLLWMFHTGTADDGLNEEFDLILDISASILIKTHHEKSVLPEAADLIFKRNRKGAFIHDLTWAYFQSREPDALRYIAKHLISRDRREAELAGTLLHMEQSDLRTEHDRRKKYSEFNEWVKENNPYLYFTGESFNLTNNPMVCNVDMEAKYLNKGISPRNRKPLSPLSEEESSCLKHFKESNENEKKDLVKFSHKLHEENPDSWKQWIQSPVEEQIKKVHGDRREKP